LLPTKPDAKVVAISRIVDVEEDAVVDAVAEFVESQDLELDRTDTGKGTLFRPRPDPQTSGPWYFGQEDSLRVVVTPVADGLRVDLVADMRGMHARGDAWRRRRYVRGGLLSVFLIGLGVQGMARGVNPGDFVPVGLGVWLGTRSVHRALNEPESREEIERNLANSLERVCDEIEENS
jgi:hypothetical protein